MNKTQYQIKDLLEQAKIHAEKAQVARRNFLSAKSVNKMNIFKKIEEDESRKAQELMKEAGI